MNYIIILYNVLKMNTRLNLKRVIHHLTDVINDVYNKPLRVINIKYQIVKMNSFFIH